MRSVVASEELLGSVGEGVEIGTIAEDVLVRWGTVFQRARPLAVELAEESIRYMGALGAAFDVDLYEIASSE
jgi:hypothetical protein